MGNNTILIIDDDENAIKLLKVMLKSENYNLLSALRGEEGLKIVADTLPDLILLDLSLPKMSGWEVIQKIRDNQEYKYLPVIALTAHAMVGDREKVLKSGCNDYLSKPCFPKDIISKVKKWLGEEDA